ncbi:MAG: hypothetical protein K9I85_07045 [Saprospiraceae bacterium]|nr:hypothetical protein [Saprospiraceae bacterium]
MIHWRLTLFILVIGVTPSLPAQSSDLMRRMYRHHEEVKEAGLDERRFKHSDILARINALSADPAFGVSTAGHSVQGREIRAVSWGSGPTTVLLWTQMHGDEPTATLATLDLWNALQDEAFLPEAAKLKERLTLVFLPLLNPDGAEVYERQNALGIDLNRDALRLTSPEAQILKHWRDSLDADWGFNLHDQHRYYSAGISNLTSAIAFLAPPPDVSRSKPPHRQDAMRLIGGLSNGLQKLIPDQVAKYSDTFEPRAFGDNFTKWGTRTILIEAGWLPGDDEKQILRRLYFATLVAALDGIAKKTYIDEPISTYNDIPFNQNHLTDLLLKEVHIQAGRSTYLVDIIFKHKEETSPDGRTWVRKAQIEEIGDLSPYGAYTILEGEGKWLIVPARTHPHVMIDMAELREEPLTDLILSGTAIIRMGQVTLAERYADAPLAVRRLDDNASEPIGLGSNPTFYLQDEKGNYRYLIVNGKAWDLRGEEWKSDLQRLIAKGLD